MRNYKQLKNHKLTITDPMGLYKFYIWKNKEKVIKEVIPAKYTYQSHKSQWNHIQGVWQDHSTLQQNKFKNISNHMSKKHQHAQLNTQLKKELQSRTQSMLLQRSSRVFSSLTFIVDTSKSEAPCTIICRYLSFQKKIILWCSKTLEKIVFPSILSNFIV